MRIVLVIFSAICSMTGLSCNHSNPASSGTRLAGSPMAVIPAASFRMGQPNPDVGGAGYSSSEQPVHTVMLSKFCMDTTEVTQGEYDSLMHYNPSAYSGDTLRPVENVTWFDAVLFCNARSRRDSLDTVYSYKYISGSPLTGFTGLAGLKIDFAKSGYRLPTEAEWEYACRGDSSTDFFWGGVFPPATCADSQSADAYTVWVHNASCVEKEVAKKLPNRFGLHDVSGNVREWCNDWYAPYDSGSATDPSGPADQPLSASRVIRGGCFSDPLWQLRSASRAYAPPANRDAPGFLTHTGFRCVKR